MMRICKVGAGTLLALFVIALYTPALKGPFLLDDTPNFAHLELLDSGVTSIVDVITSVKSGPLYRPVSMLTFALNYQASGLDPFWFKLVNLGIHLVCGLLIYLCGKLMLSKVLHQTAEREVVSGLVCGLWLIAPMFVSTVMYAVQRMTQLSTLFTLLGLFCYLGWRLGAPQIPKMRGALFLIGGSLAFVCGVLSKESALLLPFLLLVVEVGYLSGIKTVIRVPTLRWFYLASVVLPSVVAVSYLEMNAGAVFNYDHRHFSLIERLLTQSRILWDYIGQLLLPRGSGLGVWHDDYIVSTGFFSPFSTSISVLAWLAIAGCILAFWRRSDLRPIAAGVVFFLVGHSLESSVFPLELYFEHRNYLPGFGIILSAILLTRWLFGQSRMRSGGKIALVLFFTYALFVSFSTAQRTITWGSKELMVRSAYQFHPNSVRLTSEMAEISTYSGDFPSLEEYLEKGVALQPYNAGRYRIMRMIARCMHNVQVSKAELNQFESDLNFFYAPDADAELVLASADMYQRKQCDRAAFEAHVMIAYRTIVNLYQRHAAGTLDEILVRRSWKLQYAWARALYIVGAYDQSLHLVELYNSIDDASPLFDFLEGMLHVHRGNREAADKAIGKLRGYDSESMKMLRQHLVDLEAEYVSKFGSSIIN